MTGENGRVSDYTLEELRQLYSLAEIRNIRKDDNFGKGYISGRYGAIPMHEAFQKGTINDSQKYGDEVVQNLFKRRNAIAHQLDRDHASAVQTDISKVFVEDRVLEVVAIVEAIHKKAVEKG